MSEAEIIDGKAFAAGLRARIAEKVADLKAQHGVTPGLAVVLVGEDPASKVYVGSKIKQTVEAGMNSFEHKLPETATEEEILALVDKLNKDKSVHGILVQLPLPKGLTEQTITQAVAPEKDVDGLHVVNAGRLASGLEAMIPCTPLGCLLMLKDRLGSLEGKEAVVIGRSNLFGKPMGQLLLQANATPTIAHSRTKDLASVCKRADILIAAVGRAQMVKADWVKPGATVIDVGINRVEGEGGKSRIVGDVDFDAVKHVAGAITPVPGGVGPMTIACLLQNTLTAACRQNGLPDPL
jgi:methylenetetrahydrofolate dehydrogenase (NADP+)/methenyltetrahydrofolate cyclohydrolase